MCKQIAFSLNTLCHRHELVAWMRMLHQCSEFWQDRGDSATHDIHSKLASQIGSSTLYKPLFQRVHTHSMRRRFQPYITILNVAITPAGHWKLNHTLKNLVIGQANIFGQFLSFHCHQKSPRIIWKLWILGWKASFYCVHPFWHNQRAFEWGKLLFLFLLPCLLARR